MDAIVAAPYGLGQVQKDADHAEARALEEKLFPLLCNVLNRQHGVQHGPRFWRMIVGHWFRRYVDVIFNRTRTLRQCLAQHQISGTTVFGRDGYHLATQDSYSAIWAFNDDRWNHALCAELLSRLPEVDFPIETRIIDGGGAGFKWRYAGTPAGVKAHVRSILARLMNSVAGAVDAADDILIHNSYLPFKEEIKLQLLLRQTPRLPVTAQVVPPMQPDTRRRQALIGEIEGGDKGSVEYMARELLFQLLPVCYLESFGWLREASVRLPWPDKPRAIFTSNNFDTDELFKVWAADKVVRGARYVVGQHGNNYGTHRHHVYPSVEEVVSDRFLTWGWADGLPQHSPAFLLKTAGRRRTGWNAKGELLLIETVLPHRLSTWDTTVEFAEYFEEQKQFVRQLGGGPAGQLRVRLYHAHRLMGWGEQERWQEFDAALNLDDGTQTIGGLISRSRLVVHSYDSTGILETLSQDIPTLAFWQNGFEHVRDGARPWYQRLVDAGIVHLSPASAAAKVNEVWEDVPGWWQQPDVQQARREFCQRYAKTSQRPARQLRDLLNFS